MKKKLRWIMAFALLLAAAAGKAEAQAQEAGQKKDSLAYIPGAALDSTLRDKSIFSILPSKARGDRAEVTVHQSQAILDALNRHISTNSGRKITGYRVRIFNDNRQTARGASEAALNNFKSMYPGVSAYRSYTNPFFKVTVGDFRTKSEAMHLLQAIRGSFPRAFIVKETLRFPAAGGSSQDSPESPVEGN